MSEWNILVTNAIESKFRPLDTDCALVLIQEECLSLWSPSLIDFYFIDSVSPYGVLHGRISWRNSLMWIGFFEFFKSLRQKTFGPKSERQPSIAQDVRNGSWACGRQNAPVIALTPWKQKDKKGNVLDSSEEFQSQATPSGHCVHPKLLRNAP